MSAKTESSYREIVWEPFYNRKDLTFFGETEYMSKAPPEKLERRPPRDPFRPGISEDFVYRADDYSRFRPSFFQQSDRANLAVDEYGRNVFVIATSTQNEEELRVIDALTSGDRHPRNHTIPILKTIRDYDGYVLFVEPFWGMFWDWPDWDSVSDTLELARQLLEGLVFMHDKMIAHGDIHPRNILWNHNDVRTYHPERREDDLPPEPFPFRMAYIDFGFSRLFKGANTWDECPAHHPPDDYAAPEQVKPGQRYDFFAADVYNLGQVLLRHQFIEYAPYAGLLSEMTDEGPQARPTATQALERINGMISEGSLTNYVVFKPN